MAKKYIFRRIRGRIVPIAKRADDISMRAIQRIMKMTPEKRVKLTLKRESGFAGVDQGMKAIKRLNRMKKRLKSDIIGKDVGFIIKNNKITKFRRR